MTGDYRFQGEDGPVDFAGLFGDKQTLVIYSYMFGPQRERPCPMCTNLLGAWEGNAADIGQRASLAVVARSPIERLIAWKQERGWRNLRLFSDVNGAYSRDFRAIAADGTDEPALNVFTRRDGTIRHFWSDEMSGTSDPGQDPRGAPDPAPLWMVLELDARGAGGRLVSEARLRVAAPLKIVGRNTMRVMVIVKATTDSEAGGDPPRELLADMGEFNQMLINAGLFVDAGGLKESSKGARVAFSGKDRTVTHGPFPNVGELAAGYWIWKVKDVEEAIEWAKRCPNPMPGPSVIEIREMFEMDDFA